MRNRLEDLGRIYERVKSLTDHDLFDEEQRPRRPKDSIEWFRAKTDEEQDDLIELMFYRIEAVHNELYEIWSIADSTDDLNEMDRKREEDINRVER